MRLQEGLGQADRKGHAKRVPVAAGVLGGDPAVVTRNPHGDGAALPLERGQPAGWHAAGRELLRVEVAQPPEQVGCLVRVARVAPGQALQLQLQGSDCGGVEQLPQLLGPEQLGEQLAVEGQGLCPPFGKRRVALVQVLPDVVE